MLENEAIETEVSTSDIVNDAPVSTEEAKVEIEEQAPETVTLTKAELDEQKNAVAAKERARAERKLQRELQAVETRFNEKLEASKAAPKAVEGKPSLDNFDTFEDFNEALLDWKINQNSAERDAKVKVESENQRRSELSKTHISRADKFREVMPDYDKVIGNLSDVDFAVASDVVDTIMTSDLSAQLTYYFGNDIDELERINELSPLAAAREIGKIEAKLLAKPIQTSSAPSPINPVTQSKATITKDPAKMSDEEWYAQEKRARARK